MPKILADGPPGVGAVPTAPGGADYNPAVPSTSSVSRRSRRLSRSQARRLALAAQGFDRRRPSGGADVRHLRRVIETLGLLQVDLVQAVVPSHYLVPFSRLGPYDRSRLDRMVHPDRELTEHWAHEASLVPVGLWPLLGWRRRSHRVRPYSFAPVMGSHPEYMDEVLAEVAARGPLTAGDLPDPEGLPEVTSDWYRRLPRIALEAHFGFGELAVVERAPNLARVFDLPERVLPAEVLAQEIPLAEQRRRLLLRAARAHGVASAGCLADYWRMPASEAKPAIESLVAGGELVPVEVEGWPGPLWMHPEARLPRRIEARALLSPFDPVVWFRRRTARLFGFDYRFEIFVPPEKRRWGKYVLPFLLGDSLVARVDLESDRKADRLRVLAAYAEPAADGEEVAAELAAELALMAEWLDLAAVEVRPAGDLAPALGSAVSSLS